VAVIGIIVFAEKISWIKIVSALLVFVGIYFVTKKKSVPLKPNLDKPKPKRVTSKSAKVKGQMSK